MALSLAALSFFFLFNFSVFDMKATQSYERGEAGRKRQKMSRQSLLIPSPADLTRLENLPDT